MMNICSLRGGIVDNPYTYKPREIVIFTSKSGTSWEAEVYDNFLYNGTPCVEIRSVKKRNNQRTVLWLEGPRIDQIRPKE
ncbi:MAG TPA: hypothetical protein VEA18_01185 [Candidatus Kapabacteria bacterium]|nr:hypothetical protein [Candidatus Kapabacteria bacterium]